MILVIDVDNMDVKKVDLLYALELITCNDAEYSTYEDMESFEDNMTAHTDKNSDDNYVFVIDFKKKSIVVKNIQTKIRAIDVE